MEAVYNEWVIGVGAPLLYCVRGGPGAIGDGGRVIRGIRDKNAAKD
jgi:hypothetical protein